MLIYIYIPNEKTFVSRYSSKQFRPPSLPYPDCLIPPKGKSLPVTSVVLIPIIPAYIVRKKKGKKCRRTERWDDEMMLRLFNFTLSQ